MVKNVHLSGTFFFNFVQNGQKPTKSEQNGFKLACLFIGIFEGKTETMRNYSQNFCLFSLPKIRFSKIRENYY